MKKSGIQREVLNELISIFYPDGIEEERDWMGYPITKKNSPTYHHIEKACDLRKRYESDEATLENGAILGKKSHQILNTIEQKDPELYECWQYMFYVINNMGIYPIDDVWSMIHHLKKVTQDVLYPNYITKKTLHA